MMVATSNASMTDKLESLKSTSEGELMRLMQYKIDPTTNLDKREAKRIFGKLQSNYGLAGQPYAQYLVQNLEECVDNCMRVQKKFDEAVNIETRERFWSATVAANIAGSLIAGKQLGLHNINTKRVFDWVVEEVKTMQGAVRLSIEDYATIVGEFLLQHNLNILVVNKHSTSRNNIAAAPIVMPRGPLIVRYEPDTKLMFIAAKKFKEYCVTYQINYKETIKELKAKGMLTKVHNKRLSKGMQLVTGAVYCLWLDLTHPDLSSLAADMEAADAGGEG
jgi:hypothetical protein